MRLIQSRTLLERVYRDGDDEYHLQFHDGQLYRIDHVHLVPETSEPQPLSWSLDWTEDSPAESIIKDAIAYTTYCRYQEL